MAAWQKKQKPLTEEEAIALAKSQLAPLWDGSVPRFAAIRQAPDVVTVHPLDKEFAQGAWMIFFVDPLTYDGQAFARLSREWNRRYSGKAMGCLVVIRLTHAFQRAPGYLESFRKQWALPFPAVLDAEGLLATAFKVESFPWIVLLKGGTPSDAFGLRQALNGGEQTIQNFLRIQDPGLPLAPLMESIEGALTDVAKYDFSDVSLFPSPGFTQGLGKFGSHPSGADAYPVRGFRISGNWMWDGVRIATSDPQARISFRCPGTHLSIIAESLSKDPTIPAECVVELDAKPVFDSASGADLEMTDEGRKVIAPLPGKGSIFEALENLPEKNRNVDLRFPSASAAPIALYGLRVGVPF